MSNPYATKEYSNTILKQLNQLFNMQGSVFWEATKNVPFYRPINSIVGIKYFEKEVLNLFNLNKMQPQQFIQTEKFSQFIIIDVAPVPANPKKLDDISLYNEWIQAVRKDKILTNRREDIEKTGICYIYTYDLNKIINRLELLGTKMEESARIVKKSNF